MQDDRNGWKTVGIPQWYVLLAYLIQVVYECPVNNLEELGLRASKQGSCILHFLAPLQLFVFDLLQQETLKVAEEETFAEIGLNLSY